MKQGRIIEAYKATDKAATDATLSPAIKWKFFRLRQMLQPHVDFQTEQQELLGQKHHATFDRNGSFTFENEEDADRFAKDWTELINLEIDLGDFEKPSISLADVPCVDVRMMEMLDGLIDFHLEE